MIFGLPGRPARLMFSRRSAPLSQNNAGPIEYAWRMTRHGSRRHRSTPLGVVLAVAIVVLALAGGIVPARIVAILSRHIHAMQDDPAVQALLTESGLEVLKESPQEFGARIRRDHARFGDIVKAAKLKPE